MLPNPELEYDKGFRERGRENHSMPRPLRVHLKDAVYYVTLEGPEGEPIFLNQDDYDKYYNGRYERKGSLFPKRFKSVVVEKEAYLPRLTRYIHLTPVRSKLVKN